MEKNHTDDTIVILKTVNHQNIYSSVELRGKQPQLPELMMLRQEAGARAPGGIRPSRKSTEDRAGVFSSNNVLFVKMFDRFLC